jgi:hypothetical protein
MKTVLFYFALAGGSFASDQEERALWLNERREWIERAESIKDVETIENLSRIVRGIGKDLDRASPEAKELYNEAQSLLRSIPGHAKYFTDKIEAVKKENEENVKSKNFDPDWEKQPEDSVIYKTNMEAFFYMWSDYSSALTQNLGMLGHIPSTESVRALGSYLEAREDPNVKYPPPLGASQAAASLTELIADGPKLPAWPGGYSDIPHWQKWYEEVKAGKRTFRFLGDTTDYDLNGPASARKLEQIKREKARDAKRTGGNSKSDGAAIEGISAYGEKQSPFSFISAFAASFLLLAGAAWYLVRSRIKRA